VWPEALARSRRSAKTDALAAAGVQVHVTRAPQTAATPYMHARTAIADGRLAYMGSISLSPGAATYDRNVG
jgi:phosphatidylserine/phosphatidylglycerophosphate/cardiolipin synthase-like enzyme